MKTAREIDCEKLNPADRAWRVWADNKVFFQRIMRGRGATCMAIGYRFGDYYTQYGQSFTAIEEALIGRGFTRAAIEEGFFFAYL